ncbi:MAG: serine--tRNA ligase, partial [Actinomycetota bacterium]|nr:serine--tRNA ligase [Actinomycetota bacterium]
MLDLKAIRQSDVARTALARRGDGAAQTLDRVLELDARRRALLPELEGLRAEKNDASRRIGELQRQGADASEAIGRVKQVSAREKQLDAELREVQAALDAGMLALPNL